LEGRVLVALLGENVEGPLKDLESPLFVLYDFAISVPPQRIGKRSCRDCPPSGVSLRRAATHRVPEALGLVMKPIIQPGKFVHSARNRTVQVEGARRVAKAARRRAGSRGAGPSG
jgi:hypothetical protein